MSERYDVYFRGDIAPGNKMGEVRQRLQALFKLDDDRTAKLFSGRPLPIRRDLDLNTAEQYRETLLKKGALVELRSTVSKEESGDRASAFVSQPEQHTGLHQAAKMPGASDLNPGINAEPQSVLENNNSPSGEGFSLAPVGSDVLNPEERKVIEVLEVDTTQLSLSPAGVDLLLDNEKQMFEALDIDLSHLSVESFDD